MMPAWMQLTLAAVQLLGAGWIARRLKARSHPALVAFLLTQSFWQVLAMWRSLREAQTITSLTLTAAFTAVVFEVAVFARVGISREGKARLVGLTMAACAFLAAAHQGMTGQQSLYLFREYFTLALAAAAWALVILRWRSPKLESPRHRAYRVGIAAWLLVVGLGGTFIRGGLGYLVFPYTRETWVLVGIVTHIGVAVIVAGMSVAMVCRSPRRVGAVSARPRRRSRVVAIGRAA